MTTARSFQYDAALFPPTSVTPPVRSLAVSSLPRAGTGPALPAGTVVGGRYVLERLVEQGGMGSIYAARDRRLQRKVAVKMMLADVAARPGYAQRFEREAKLTAGINHPNCMAAYDYGIDRHGHYLVVEWVEGRTLEALVAKEGPLSLERAAALIAQLCDGLSDVHARGFVHRDVKPGNVMVTSTPAGERVRLVDFGIARAVDERASRVTQVGCSIGSPPFMSPEQAQAGHVDAASDVYSTAATLYYALSGRPPYLGGELEVRQQLLNAGPPDLPVALVDHPLAAVLKRALARPRTARPRDAAELGKMIRKAAAGRAPVRAVPGTGAGLVVPLPRPERRKPAAPRAPAAGGARPPGTAPITSVKGIVYQTLKATVVEELGEARWNEFITGWRKSHPHFPGQVLSLTRLPVQPFLEMQDALVQRFYGGDSNAFWHIGVKSGERALTRGELAGLFRPDEARRLLLFAPHIYRSYFDGGELTSTLKGDVVTIAVTGQPAHLYFEYGLLGFIQGGLKALVPNADWPRRVKGFSLGDDTVQYQIDV